MFPASNVAEQWTQASRRLVRQNDGLVDLWQTPDVLDQLQAVDTLPINLWGMGGEIARGYYMGRRLLLSSLRLKSIEHFLVHAVVRTHGIVKPEAVALSRRLVKDFVAEAADEGFAPVAIPDVFYAYERVRRWAGSNNRKSLPTADHFALLCTRPFVEAAFSVPVVNRHTEPLHYELTKMVPRLHEMPFAGGPWRPQIPGLSVLRKHSVRAEGALWVETVLPAVRTFCLDHQRSPLWDFIDRQAFAHASARAVLSAATLFQYFEDKEPMLEG